MHVIRLVEIMGIAMLKNAFARNRIMVQIAMKVYFYYKSVIEITTNDRIEYVFVGLGGIGSAVLGFVGILIMKSIYECCNRKPKSKKELEAEEEEKHLKEYHEVNIFNSIEKRYIHLKMSKHNKFPFIFTLFRYIF